MKNFKRVLSVLGLGLFLLSGCGSGTGSSSDMIKRQNLQLDYQVNENNTDTKTSRYLTYDSHKENKWQNNTINWWYNPTNQFYSTDDTLETIKKAMNSWESVCGIKFNYQGITYQSPSNTENDKFVISWVDNYTLTRWAGGKVGGLARSWVRDGYVSDAEVFLNYSLFHSSITLYAFQGLLTHELGHVIGIDHSNVEGAVMSGRSSGTKYLPWEEQAELKDDDIRAARSLYPIQQVEKQDQFTIVNGQVISSRWLSSDTPSHYRTDSYARSYNFTLNSSEKIQISLSSSVDTYLYLVDSYGNIIDENDDFDGTNSQIETTLYRGTYTIIATTYGASEMGSFNLEYKILRNDNPNQPEREDDPSAMISNLTVSSITDHSATITWDGDATVKTWVYVHEPYNSTGSKHNTRNGSYTYASLASGITFTVYIEDDNGNTLRTNFTTRTSGQQPSTNQYYGAFAYSRSTSEWGYSYRYNSEQQARQTAISYCGRSDCSVLQVIRADECMSYAAIPNGGGYWSVNTNKTTAQNNALYDCNHNMSDSCSVQFTICANGR